MNGTSANVAPTVPQKKRRRPTDKSIPAKVESFVPEAKLYTDLVNFEKRLDALMVRKQMDLQESAFRTLKIKQLLRVTLSHHFTNADDSLDYSLKQWKLQIKGHLLSVRNKQEMIKKQSRKQKFSSFLKSIYVELSIGESNFIEWKKSPQSQEFDGFTISRMGQSPSNVKFILHLDYSPEKFKLSAPLANLLGLNTETKPAIVMALWQYIKSHKCQDIHDKKMVNNDDDLFRIFGLKRMTFSTMSESLHSHLLPPDPIVLEYSLQNIHVPVVYDIQVDVDDPSKNSFQSYLTSNLNSKELSVLDQRIIDLIQLINKSKMKREFMLSFAEKPVEFINQWVSSQTRDLETILGDGHISLDESRSASFYEQEWVREAVSKYLDYKHFEKMGDMVK